MAFKRVVNKRASVWHLCDGAAWKPGFHLTLLAKSADWKLQNMITHAPCCFLTRQIIVLWLSVCKLPSIMNTSCILMHTSMVSWSILNCTWHNLSLGVALSVKDSYSTIMSRLSESGMCSMDPRHSYHSHSIRSTMKWKSFGLTLQLGLTQPTSIFKWYDYIIMLSMSS